MGKPRLGDITRAQIRIKESKEFKVSVCLTISNVLSRFDGLNGQDQTCELGGFNPNVPYHVRAKLKTILV